MADQEEGKTPPRGRQQMTFAPRRDETYGEIVAFLDRFGTPLGAFPDPAPGQVHVEVMIHPPGRCGEEWLLTTVGMSDVAMEVPPQFVEEATPRIELMIRLPPWWHHLAPGSTLPSLAASEAWPVTWLQEIARQPQELGIWLGSGTLVVLPPPGRAPEIPFVGAILANPATLPEDGNVMRRGDGEDVRFVEVVPLRQDEVEFAEVHGINALLERFDIYVPADPKRASVFGAAPSLKSAPPTRPSEGGAQPVIPLREGTVPEIARHLSAQFGEPAAVFRDVDAQHVHVKVLAYAPTRRVAYWTLVTAGMADVPMRVPAEFGAMPRAELTMRLPARWHAVTSDGKVPRLGPLQLWPLGWLQALARLPHARGTWFGHWHTVPLAPPDTEPRTGFVGVLLSPASHLDADVMIRGDGGLQFLEVVPLYGPEMDFAKSRGVRALTKRFKGKLPADHQRESTVL